jgi:hypothetical protein
MQRRTDSPQCLCGAPNCRGWLGKTPQEFDLENSGTSKKSHPQKQKPAARLGSKVKIVSSQTDEKKAVSEVVTAPLARSLCGGAKRSLDVDEFGLSAAQKRLQLKAMAKLQQKCSEKIQDAQVIDNVVAPVSVYSRKRALDVDEFGLTAAQRRIQMQALAKLQQ